MASGQSGGAALLAGALGAVLTILLVAEARRLAVLALEQERWEILNQRVQCGGWWSLAFVGGLLSLALLVLVSWGWVLVSVI